MDAGDYAKNDKEKYPALGWFLQVKRFFKQLVQISCDSAFQVFL